jgi:phosphoglycolate phosphatase
MRREWLPPDPHRQISRPRAAGLLNAGARNYGSVVFEAGVRTCVCDSLRLNQPLCWVAALALRLPPPLKACDTLAGEGGPAPDWPVMTAQNGRETDRMSQFLLVFDLDGTLVDSAPDLRAALNLLLHERGRAPLSLPQVRRMIGDGVPALVARALAASGLDTADAADAVARFLELYEADAVRLTRPYPEVPETLAALRRRGYRTAICTNKPQHATITVLNGLGLTALFDGIAGGDRFAVKKPDPGHLLGLIDALGGSAEAAAMVGDNENDAAAAHAAGMPLVLMRYGYARVDPASLGAAALLDRFADLPAALASLGLRP